MIGAAVFSELERPAEIEVCRINVEKLASVYNNYTHAYKLLSNRTETAPDQYGLYQNNEKMITMEGYENLGNFYFEILNKTDQASFSVEPYLRLTTDELYELFDIGFSLEGGIDADEKTHGRVYDYNNITDPGNRRCQINCTDDTTCVKWKGDKETGSCFLDPGTEAWKDYQRSTCDKLWTFEGALYFCFTVISTIGYGNIAPKTEGGRIFFLFYCIPGVGIFGVLLARIQAIFGHVINHGKV